MNCCKSIELRDVSKRFPINQAQSEWQYVLESVSLHITKGEKIAVIGSSGCGKTTLLRLLNRLEERDSGNIYFGGRSIDEMDVLQLRRNVSLVFQIPILFAGTVRDNILLTLNSSANRYNATNNFDDKLEELMTAVQLAPDLLDSNAEHLSVGQKQRVALARTLGNDPQVLLLDEVTSSLDPSTAKRIIQLINNLSNELELTIIWVTHEIEKIRWCNRVIFLHNGKIVEEDTPENLVNSPNHPATKEFLEGQITYD